MNVVARFLVKYLGIPLVLKLGSWIVAWVSKESKLQSLQKENAELRKKLEGAQTPVERENATADLARHFNRDK